MYETPHLTFLIYYSYGKKKKQNKTLLKLSYQHNLVLDCLIEKQDSFKYRTILGLIPW
jgi:hypothetical protein